LNFLSAAFYEEVLYRFYFTDELKNLLGRRFFWKWLGWACEMTGLLCFAFAHSGEHVSLAWRNVANSLPHITQFFLYGSVSGLQGIPCFVLNTISLHFFEQYFAFLFLAMNLLPQYTQVTSNSILSPSDNSLNIRLGNR
jgi:hypothetical protein